MMSTADLARTYGMAEENVIEAIASKDDADAIAKKYGIAPVVAAALVGSRKVRKKK